MTLHDFGLGGSLQDSIVLVPRPYGLQKQSSRVPPKQFIAAGTCTVQMGAAMMIGVQSFFASVLSEVFASSKDGMSVSHTMFSIALRTDNWMWASSIAR
jgi:hypothetical protein